MPDPFNYFTLDKHNYYLKCKKIYSEQNKICNENMKNIYTCSSLNIKYDFSNIISKFSEKIKFIFDNVPKNIQPEKKINILDFRIRAHTGNNKFILAYYLEKLNDNLFNDVKNISIKTVRTLEKDFKIYLNPYNFVIYRNIKVNKKNIKSNTFGGSSWRYHCDNDSPIKIKVFIYLNDVNEMNGPFEILCNLEKNLLPKLIPFGNKEWDWGVVDVNQNDNDEEPYYIKKYKTDEVVKILPNTRVNEDTIKILESKGYNRLKITGEKGMMFPCQVGLIHRANISEKGYRDLLCLECIVSEHKIDDKNFTMTNDRNINLENDIYKKIFK